jgi:hypothetical protein
MVETCQQALREYTVAGVSGNLLKHTAIDAAAPLKRTCLLVRALG